MVTMKQKKENLDKTRKKVVHLFKPGKDWDGNAKGRPKGSFSIKTRIIQMLKENPEQFEELCRYYIKDKRMRDLLWKMIDGLPRQAIDLNDGDNKQQLSEEEIDGKINELERKLIRDKKGKASTVKAKSINKSK